MQKQALVVDDSRVARLTLSRLLTPYDVDIVQIASGEEALSYLRSNEINPDIIFMDVTMQGIDGIETTKKIKENMSLSSIPVVMCTGHDTQDEQNKAFAVGAVASLTKPPKEDVLAGIMAKLDRQPETEIKVERLLTAVPELLVSPVSAEMNITPSPTVESDKTIINQLEQDWLPSIQKSIDERVGNITRRVATETAKGVLFQQSIASPQSTSNESDLKFKITKIIKSDVLPEIEEKIENMSRQVVLESVDTSVANHVTSLIPSLREQTKQDTVEIAQQTAIQSVRETVESISRQIIPDLIDASIAGHTTGLLSSLKSQLKEQTKQTAVEMAQQTAQKMIDETAESAVQFAIDDFDLQAKAMEALDQQGTVWLTQQEQHLSLVASQQAEQNVSPLVSQYLDVNLTDKIAAYIAEREASKPKKDNSEIRNINFQLEELTQKVSFLKEVVVVLSVVVVGVVAVSLLLNVGIL